MCLCVRAPRSLACAPPTYGPNATYAATGVTATFTRRERPHVIFDSRGDAVRAFAPLDRAAVVTTVTPGSMMRRAALLTRHTTHTSSSSRCRQVALSTGAQYGDADACQNLVVPLNTTARGR